MVRFYNQSFGNMDKTTPGYWVSLFCVSQPYILTICEALNSEYDQNMAKAGVSANMLIKQ